MPHLSRYSLGLLLALLGACTQLPQRTSDAWQPPDWPVWSLRGRVAVHAGEEGWHASLAWRQTGAAFQLELSGPLGQGAVRMSGDAAGVTLDRADGLRDWAPDADTLLVRNTGWTLPISGLRYWVQGRAVPGRPARWEHGPDGRPLRLRQDGWDIRYSSYHDQPGREALPKRIDLERGEIRARLLIDTWMGPAVAPGAGGDG
ncbi:MAG TPA: lipoprotein insertase outer membrane protein LolB [Gammaproteobacteria bacterium]